MNPLKKLAGQTAIYGLSSIIGRLLNYLLVPLYTRYFTTSEYGEVTTLYAYVAFLVIILTYGMETAFFRFSQREQDKKSVYSTTLISLLISSTAFIVLMFVNADSVAIALNSNGHPEYSTVVCTYYWFRRCFFHLFCETKSRIKQLVLL